MTPRSGTSSISSSAKRKTNIPLPPVGSSTNGRTATFTPLFSNILAACFPSSRSTETITPHPSPPLGGPSGGNGKRTKTTPRKPKPVARSMVARARDLRNDRSAIPSPKEVAKMERIALSLAAEHVARAPTPRLRGPSRRGSEGSGTGGSKRGGSRKPAAVELKRQRSTSANTPTPLAPSTLPNLPAAPAIRNIPPTPAEQKANPFGTARAPLKRTRSAGGGLLTVNASLANSNIVPQRVGSPLKLVVGAHDEDAEDGTEPSAKRTRRDASPMIRSSSTFPALRAGAPQGPIGLGVLMPDRALRAKTVSPPPSTTDLPDVTADPDSLPLAGAASSFSHLSRALSGGSSMRRVASASPQVGYGVRIPSPEGKTRSSSFGEQGNGRSRREVAIPARLRDYEMVTGSV